MADCNWKSCSLEVKPQERANIKKKEKRGARVDLVITANFAIHTKAETASKNKAKDSKETRGSITYELHNSPLSNPYLPSSRFQQTKHS
ncbi:hypothetical protein BPOR_0305g00080 [Botrytis porri]|uniref:Uncharacterized protein n=1 Tax=Botrytis porri TaxID=87229 RepID=A0A4Z1KPT3_9HELO|nr:hypothetical protein BPOR_0305g00080 [Botrytis porri]